MEMPLPYCTYVLFSLKDFHFYIGYITNLKKRIENHDKGGTKSTAPRRPLKLIFCEFYLSQKDAERREKYLKTTAGKKGLKLILRETLKALKCNCREEEKSALHGRAVYERSEFYCIAEIFKGCLFRTTYSFDKQFDKQIRRRKAEHPNL